MAFKLTKAENKQRDELVANLEVASAALSEAVETANEQIALVEEGVNIAIEAYNEALSAAREFAQDIASRLEEEIGEKTEKWQEGENGQAAEELRNAWAELDLEDIEPITIEQVVDFDLSHRDDLENLPDGKE